MKSKKTGTGPDEGYDVKDSSRRNFIRQSTLLTAVALTPGTAMKAAADRVD